MTPHKIFAEFLAIYAVFLIQAYRERENLLLRLMLYFIFVLTTDEILSNHIRDMNDVEFCVNYLCAACRCFNKHGRFIMYLLYTNGNHVTHLIDVICWLRGWRKGRVGDEFK